MPRPALFFLMLITCAMTRIVAAAADERNATSAFGTAHLVPDDVTMYLHVRDAASIRSELADRPIFNWVREMVESADARDGWQQLADRVGVPSERLFDLCFGRDVTFLRRTNEATDVSEWAIITHMPPRRITRLLERLEPKVLRPRFGAARFELPEQEILLARREHVLLVAPANHPQLLMDVLRHLNEPRDNPLNATAPFSNPPRLDSPRLGLFIRHAPPLGGWSMLAASIEENRIRLRQIARFDVPPLTREPTALTIDGSPLELLEDQALIAIIEPTDIGPSLLETYFQIAVGEGLQSRPMRRATGDRRIIVLGEIEGRQEGDPIDLQAPTIAVCLEIKGLDTLHEELDRQMLRLAERLNAIGRGRFELSVPSMESIQRNGERHVDLSPATRWIAGDLPIVKPVSLNWAVADGASGRYWVIASHPHELSGTVSALTRARRTDAIAANPSSSNVNAPPYQQAGVAQGVRIAHHLTSWAEQAKLLAEPGREGELMHALQMLSKLAAGMERIRWTIARPDRHEMHIEATITLTPPESAGGE